MQSAPMKICPKCQTPTALDSKFCNKCGHGFRTDFSDQTQLARPILPQTQYQAQPNQNLIYRPDQSTTTPVLLAFVLTGGGQMANGQVGKGFFFLGVVIVLCFTFWIGAVLIWIMAILDAILISQRLQRGEAVGQWQFF